MLWLSIRTLTEIRSVDKGSSCGLEDKPSFFRRNSDFPITNTPNWLSCPVNLLFGLPDHQHPKLAFLPSKPPIQEGEKMPCSFTQNRRSTKLNVYLNQIPRLRMSGALPPFSLCRIETGPTTQLQD